MSRFLNWLRLPSGFAVGRVLGWTLSASLAGCSLAGCGAANGGACTPGDGNCADVDGAAPLQDPRFVGPGMKGAALPHWPMFRHDSAHSGKNSIAPRASGFVAWTA